MTSPAWARATAVSNAAALETGIVAAWADTVGATARRAAAMGSRRAMRTNVRRVMPLPSGPGRGLRHPFGGSPGVNSAREFHGIRTDGAGIYRWLDRA